MITLLKDARRGHAGLYAATLGFAVLTVALVVAAAMDPRTLLGAEVWIKPLKFAISFTAYCGALAWMLGQLPKPALQRTGWVLVATAAIEQVIITVQAGRQQLSHFNTERPVGTLLFAVMGATVVVLWLATAAVALRFLREPARSRSTAVAIRLGLVVSLVGMAVGFLMVGNFAHTVGLADGSPGMFLTGWSTVAGDLRIAHFVGLHALQLLPLLAAGLAHAPRLRLDETGRVRVVVTVAAAYLGLVLLPTWQALRGQPLLAPDAITLAALAALVLATVGGIAHAVVTSGRRSVVTV